MRSVYCGEGLASVCLLLADSADCFQKPLRNSTSTFLEHITGHPGASGSLPGHQRKQRGMWDPSVTVPLTIRSIIALQCRPPKPLGLLQILVNSCEPALSHDALPESWYKAGTLSFPFWITDTLNTKVMGKRHKGWSQAVKAAEWDNHRELLNSNGATQKDF